MRLTYPLLTVAIVGAFTLLAGDNQASLSGSSVLGTRQFSYQCVTDADPYCSDSLGSGDRIALGSRFDYETDVYSAADGVVVDPDSGHFVATRAGWSTLIATSGVGPVVINDLLHIEVIEPVDMWVLLQSPPKSGILSFRLPVGDGESELPATLDLGAEVTLTAVSIDEKQRILAGAFPIEWTIDDPAIVELVHAEDATTKNQIFIRANALGSTRMHVTFGPLTKSFSVEVNDVD